MFAKRFFNPRYFAPRYFPPRAGAAAVSGPYCVVALGLYVAGSQASNVYVAGAAESGVYVAGAVAAQECCE